MTSVPDWIGSFADDLAPEGLLHGFVLRSPHAHARLLALDVAETRAAPACGSC